MPSDEETSSVDIERYAADRISARIAERFAVIAWHTSSRQYSPHAA